MMFFVVNLGGNRLQRHVRANVGGREVQGRARHLGPDRELVQAT